MEFRLYWNRMWRERMDMWSSAKKLALLTETGEPETDWAGMPWIKGQSLEQRPAQNRH